MMVCSFGMVEGIGPVRYGEFRNHPHSRIDAPLPDSLGNETAREIDIAIRNLVKEALDTARKLLKENAGELEKLAQALLEKETLDISEINVLLNRVEVSETVEENEAVDIAPAADDCCEEVGNTVEMPEAPENDTDGK
jgi:cell division protease FtsH